MAQCALTQYDACWEANGSLFIPVSDFFQNINGTLTLDTFGPGTVASIVPLPGVSTPGQSYTMFAGTINVQTDGVQIDFDGSLPAAPLNNHNIQVCASDDISQTCCTINITFDPANCATVGSCIQNNVIQPGAITPSDFVVGATSFSTTQNVIAAKTGVQESGVNPTGFDLACTGTTDGSITVRMLDNSECTAEVDCSGVVTGTCITGPILPGTHAPSAFKPGAIAFASPDASIVQSAVGINVTTANSGAVAFNCTGTTDGSITVRLEDGSECTRVVTCGATSTLSCGPTSITVSPGQIISAASFISGGTPPYAVTSATGVLSVVGGAAQVSNTAVVGGTSETVTISDATGSIACNVTILVEDTTADCINVADSTVTVSPSPATAGAPLVITADINPSSGGLAGHSLLVKDPSGATIGIPSAIPATNQWNFQLPIASLCQDGTYTVCVVPPTGTACPQWNNAAAIPVTGCDNTVECTTTVNGLAMTGPNSPGSTQTLTLPADQCTCDGWEINFVDLTDYPADGSIPVIAGFTVINPTTATWQIPVNAPSGAPYQVKAQCCPVTA